MGEEAEKKSFNQAFKVERPKYNDIWAGLLLIAVFLGYVAVSGITLHGYASANLKRDTPYLDTNTVIIFCCCIGVALALSFAYVWLARLFPKFFIWATGILNICLAFGTAIYYLYRHYWSAGIVFLVFAIFFAFCFWTWIPRIPFSALMLRTSIDISKNYGHVYLVSLLGGLVAAAFAAWYSITLVAIYVRYQPSPDNSNCSEGGCGQGKVIGLIAFITFAMYWFSEWLKNIIHTAIAGVYGSWYFRPHDPPRGATRGALKRALTYSFGSISFGSLIVAIIQCLRELCSIARGEAANQFGMAGQAIFCLLGCLIGLLEWLVQFFNRYAFCHIALYGKAYIPAAKDTWKVIKDRGIDALVNDCLINNVLSFGGLAISYLCALLAYLYLEFYKPAYNSDGSYTPVVMAFATLIGLQISFIITTPISSGIETIFVAMAWDPQVLYQEHPELYNEMVRVYPKVQSVVQGRGY